MSRISLQTVQSAPQASRPWLERSLAAYGFLPNLVASLANAPTALETYLTVADINAKSGLSLAERETVQLSAATINNCGFCVAGHTAIALNQAHMDKNVVDELRNKQSLSDPRLDAVALFTKQVIATRGSVSDEDLEAFRSAGFSDQNALEVVLGISLATLCNFANNLAQNEINPQFAAYQWTGAVGS
jgi:uncharacterized peroxidase-related enzyme